MGWVVNATPRPLYLRERPGTHSTEGWVEPSSVLNVRGKSRPQRDSVPDRPHYSELYTGFVIVAHSQVNIVFSL